jgi:squalene-hopene/tetraprenyl-beta-curcumene cyclase
MERWRNGHEPNGKSADSSSSRRPLVSLSEEFHPAIRRAVCWLLAMQNRDGGWAAFDREITRDVLTRVPFADHNAMLDPSCPDITARVLEALGGLGFRVGHSQVDRALLFLQKTQCSEGCWLGRWGVNYVYGTWQVLVGLKAVNFETGLPLVRRAAAWLKKVQQPGGAWGETCRSYDDPSLKGQGTPTASQTAWALLGLMAAGEIQSDAVRRGINYLLATQQADGGWHEDEFTGTGFPKVFYLKYHMYALYFPLMAIARYERDKGKRKKSEAGPSAGHCYSRVPGPATVSSS